MEKSELTAAEQSSAVAGGAGKAETARASIWASLRACGLFMGHEIEEEELKKKLVMPEYIRKAIAEAAKARDVAAGIAAAGEVSASGGTQDLLPPEAPVVVFVNSKSGGRHGPELELWLHGIINKEQVLDLAVVKPPAFVEYGLGCLEKLADQGDECAKAIRERLRIVVAGGDGTVGWVLGCLRSLNKENREPIPPTAIIPLGTGNDLSRTFGWGGSFPFAWHSAIKRYLNKAATAPICRLDSWQIVLVMPEGEIPECPPALKKVDALDQIDLDQADQGELPEKVSCFEGVFYNYFSIGMDAQVAYGFHHLRNEKQHLARGPLANKLIYAGFSCTQGWFCTQCTTNPKLSGLKSTLQLYIKRVNCSEWEEIHIHPSVRSLVILNLYNYGGGRHPWGDLDPEYLEKRGFVEAHADDGLLEIFGLKEGWHASFVLAKLIKAKHIAQAAAIKLKMKGAQWNNRAYLQMDGEPWRQPLDDEEAAFLEIKKVPYHSLMLSGQ